MDAAERAEWIDPGVQEQVDGILLRFQQESLSDNPEKAAYAAFMIGLVNAVDRSQRAMRDNPDVQGRILARAWAASTVTILSQLVQKQGRCSLAAMMIINLARELHDHGDKHKCAFLLEELPSIVDWACSNPPNTEAIKQLVAAIQEDS